MSARGRATAEPTDGIISVIKPLVFIIWTNTGQSLFLSAYPERTNKLNAPAAAASIKLRTYTLLNGKAMTALGLRRVTW